MGSRIGRGLRRGAGWRPGKASRGGFGIPRRRVGSGSRRISGSWRKRVGKGGLGAGLRGSHMSHSDRRSRERGGRQRSVGSGAGRKGRSRAVGQRQGRRSRWKGFCWIRGNVRRRRRKRRLRVPAALLGPLRLPHDLLQLFHSDPAQVGQLPHPGKLLQERLQGHLALQEPLGHFLEERNSLGLIPASLCSCSSLTPDLGPSQPHPEEQHPHTSKDGSGSSEKTQQIPKVIHDFRDWLSLQVFEDEITGIPNGFKL